MLRTQITWDESLAFPVALYETFSRPITDREPSLGAKSGVGPHRRQAAAADHRHTFDDDSLPNGLEVRTL